MQKNRKMAGKVCDVIGHMLNFPFFAKLDITNIIILLFSLSIFLISLTPPLTLNAKVCYFCSVKKPRENQFITCLWCVYKQEKRATWGCWYRGISSRLEEAQCSLCVKRERQVVKEYRTYRALIMLRSNFTPLGYFSIYKHVLNVHYIGTI